MSTLIVLLPLEPATGMFDYVLTSDGRSAGSHDHAPVALLPRSAELVAVVPAQALSWHQVTLPKGSLKQGTLGGAIDSPRLRAVLEGLLEDRLLEEPTELHFALQPDAPTDGPVWVAACNRAWLRAALAVLEAAKRPVARIVPECAPDSLRLQVLGTPEFPQLLSTSLHGVSLLPLNTATLAMAQAMHTEAVDLVAEPAVAGLAEQLAQRPVTLQQASERWLDSARGRWDLAQFDLSNSTRSRAWKGLAAQATVWLQAPQWRAARWGLALLLLAQIVGLNAWAWKESNSLQAKRVALRTILTQTFPGVKVVVDAPVQMARELALLRQTAGATSARDLEAMLSVLGTALPPQQAATALDFAPGEARLKGLPTGSDTATAESLRAQGYGVRAEGNLFILQPIPQPATGAAP
ncbi:type II secretion system protein GspL [Rhodoferax sp.]|uniref:type II secretion system protein GspL n=1 Tax=Rhodoferax sp. TaxID=50421 RepID=UPI0025F356A8|nr:type II secretion system protein GspL [Rhodoferax sp.]